MLPRFSEHDHRNVLEGHAELIGEFLLGDTTRSVALPNADDRGFVKLGNPSIRTRGTANAILRHHVGNVVDMGAKEQVSRITTWRIVALMEHPEIIRDVSVGQSPRDTGRLPKGATEHECAVALFERTRLPLPAIIGAATINLRPKAIFDRLSMMVSNVARVRTVAPFGGPLRMKGGATSNTGLNDRRLGPVRRAATLRAELSLTFANLVQVNEERLAAVETCTRKLGSATFGVHLADLLDRFGGVSRPGALQRCRVFPLPQLYQNPRHYGEIGGVR